MQLRFAEVQLELVKTYPDSGYELYKWEPGPVGIVVVVGPDRVMHSFGELEDYYEDKDNAREQMPEDVKWDVEEFLRQNWHGGEPERED